MKRITILVVLFVILVANITACQSSYEENDMSSSTEWRQYRCDVKHLNLVTTIDVYKKGDKYRCIRGESIFLRSVHDPLKIYDVSGNLIASAGDVYHFISQDSHSVVDADGNLQIEMAGNIEIWGESYVLYNNEQSIIGYLYVGGTNTGGTIKDIEGDVIVKYTSSPLFDDYNVDISPNCQINDDYILLLFASYFSDIDADRK